MIVALETAKQYLRVDYEDDDNLITNFIITAEKLCKDILRTDEDVELSKTPEVEVAVLFAIAYLYEHREEVDYKALIKNLRSVLCNDRREVF